MSQAEDDISLKIIDLKLKNFRNYDNLYLKNINNLVIFSGKNAVGKTNILEAIQLITTQQSFRNPLNSELILFGEEKAYIDAELSNKIRKLSINIEINSKNKKYLLNKKTKKSKDLKSLIPSVLFTPDDLNLIKGGNTRKREAFDSLGMSVSSNYYTIKRDYERILLQKNTLLKEGTMSSILESVNEMLIKIGTQLFCYRYTLGNRLIEIFKEKYPKITGKNEYVDIEITPSWGDREGCDLSNKENVIEVFKEALKKKNNEEIQRKRSLIGPHKDAYTFLINGRDAKNFSSQGQQRSLVLCFKLSEVDLIKKILNQKPVLLLDDVMSELDEQRREALINYINSDIQTFITTTNIQYFENEIIDKAQIIELPRNYE